MKKKKERKHKIYRQINAFHDFCLRQNEKMYKKKGKTENNPRQFFFHVTFFAFSHSTFSVSIQSRVIATHREILNQTVIGFDLPHETSFTPFHFPFSFFFIFWYKSIHANDG